MTVHRVFIHPPVSDRAFCPRCGLWVPRMLVVHGTHVLWLRLVDGELLAESHQVLPETMVLQ